MLGGACVLLLHLAARAVDTPALVYVRQSAISMVSAVNRPNDPELARARAFVGLEERGIYVSETPEEVVRMPCLT
ncbi:hypothetical protein [Methylorubrum suomiense]|uniref:Uncharacterized protein n=1 Tax=Methylorubrum suomiense TaxID=144191 RepID=A0ABQ4V0Y8_9HYPH|nr:hypothetical protein [Methylorubrum suomiense]GJE77304.1 hypothetical protein BGCPKDLD_3907 [Methylorubrum suomiense]